TNSFEVKASRPPPMESTERAISSAVRFLVPLNTMCSMKWEIPVSSGDSSREPVPIHRPTETLRTWGMRSVITRTTLGRVWRSISRDAWRIGILFYSSGWLGLRFASCDITLGPAAPDWRNHEICEVGSGRRHAACGLGIGRADYLHCK